MKRSAPRTACICLALAAATAAVTAQERALPDITIPVAPAQPTITATVSLVSGTVPRVRADAMQLDADSGLALMEGVLLEDAELWTRTVPERASVPFLKSIPVIAQAFEEEPTPDVSAYSRALEESLLRRGPEHPDVKALTQARAEYEKAAAPGSAPAQLPDPYRSTRLPIASENRYMVDGVALKSESRELALDEEQAIELSWPDDRPRYYLEQQGEDLFRRVQLADKEGYAVTLRAGRVGGKLKVDLDLTRNTLAGGRYDGTINAYVGKPTLIKTICQTSIPVTANAGTVVTWKVPGRVVDREATAQFGYPADFTSVAGSGGAAAKASSKRMPGLAIVLSTQPLPAATPPAPVPDEAPDAPAAGAPAPAVEGPAAPAATPPAPVPDEPPDAPAAGAAAPAVEEPAAPAGGPPAPATELPGAPAEGPAVPAGAEPEEAEKVGAHVQVDFKFVEVPVSSPEWPKLAEWRGVTSIDEAREALAVLAHRKVGRVIASPSLVALDGHRAEMNIGYSENYSLEAAPAGPNEGFDLNARQRVLQVPLGLSVAVTPRLEANGQVSLALETHFEELLDKFGEGEAQAVPIIGTREANVRLQVAQGKTAIVRGLVRMDQEAGEDGKAVKMPVETLILVTPRVITEAFPE